MQKILIDLANIKTYIKENLPAYFYSSYASLDNYIITNNIKIRKVIKNNKQKFYKYFMYIP
jgi:hypothetical protein